MPAKGHVGVAVFDSNILPFEIAEIAKALLECLQEPSRCGRGTEKADRPNFPGRLRVARTRRRGEHGSEATYEGASVHLIT
jgi:hypothetical protein